MAGNSGGNFYASTGWDPSLIVAQILSLQFLFYLALGACFGFFHLFLGTPVSLGMFFSHEKVHFNSGAGWVAVLASLGAAALGACALVAIVERAKKCLDFSVTVYGAHCFLCWCYGGFPDRWEWWAVEGVCLALMAVLGLV